MSGMYFSVGIEECPGARYLSLIAAAALAALEKKRTHGSRSMAENTYATIILVFLQTFSSECRRI